MNFSRQGGALLVGIIAAASVIVASTAHAQSLPTGWSSRDIGSPAVKGSASATGDTITLAGAGTDIGGTADQFHFVSSEMSGDIDFNVLLENFQTTNPAAKAGLMIRETTAAGAEYAFVFANGGQQVSFQSRSRLGAKTATGATNPATLPVWLRLVRKGNVFKAYTATDGQNWTQIDSATISMNNRVQVGVAVTSSDAARTATAAFSSAQFATAPVPGGLPAPWTAADIGSPSLAGSSTAANSVFTVQGGGSDIGGTTDQFHYLYQRISGDVEIIARLASLQAADAWTKAGLMIRETLNPNAAHASVILTGGNGWGFLRRLSSGVNGYYTTGPAGTAPGWLRLTRQGSTVRTFLSVDGVTWQQLGSDTIALPSTIYVGFAVSSHKSNAAATATFSNVSVSGITSTNNPPTVTLTTPAPSFTAPASVTMNAAASDSDGTIARVDFYVNSQPTGSDSGSPYSFTVNNLAIGSYNLTAVAIDNNGSVGYSNLVVITVAGATTPAPSTRLAFVPPVDYVTNVSTCTVELRRSTDAPTATPAASLGVGKPAVVNGEIIVDITALLSPLSAGSYYAIVVSSGQGGSTPSSPSAVFTK